MIDDQLQIRGEFSVRAGTRPVLKGLFTQRFIGFGQLPDGHPIYPYKQVMDLHREERQYDEDS